MVAVNGAMTNEYCSNASSSFGHGFLHVEFGSVCDFDPPLSLSLLSYFLCYGCSESVFVLLGVVGLGFEEGFALVLV